MSIRVKNIIYGISLLFMTNMFIASSEAYAEKKSILDDPDYPMETRAETEKRLMETIDYAEKGNAQQQDMIAKALLKTCPRILDISKNAEIFTFIYNPDGWENTKAKYELVFNIRQGSQFNMPENLRGMSDYSLYPFYFLGGAKPGILTRSPFFIWLCKAMPDDEIIKKWEKTHEGFDMKFIPLKNVRPNSF